MIINSIQSQRRWRKCFPGLPWICELQNCHLDLTARCNRTDLWSTAQYRDPDPHRSSWRVLSQQRQMAVWRFGSGDFSWEWDLVTLGIVTTVLAVLAILAFCCLLDGMGWDGNGGCICFCCCLLVVFVILIGVGFGLGLRASEQPYISSSLRKSVTIYNQQCWSKCTKNKSPYFWCW